MKTEKQIRDALKLILSRSKEEDQYSYTTVKALMWVLEEFDYK